MITLLLSSETSFLDVIQQVDAGGQGYVALTNSEGLLQGMVTDGDIRRCLLKGSQTLEELVNRSPITLVDTTSNEEAIALLKNKHLKHLPIIDSNNQLKKVITLDESIFSSKKNKVVIMAGGLGSRLGSLTQNTPKPMLKLAEKPIIQHVIEQFREQGFCKFIICTAYKREVIEDYFKNGKEFGVQISYVNEKKRLGTAGALSLIDSRFSSHPFFVVNADVLTNVNYDQLLEYHISNEALATMCVRNVKEQIKYGVIECDEEGKITEIKEKPTFEYKINAGVYVLSPNAMKLIPKNEFFDMPQLFLELERNNETTFAFPVNDYWIDIGHPQDYSLAKKRLEV